MEELLSEHALRLLEQRYLLRNAAGKIIETPEQMFRRVADAVAKAELKWYDADTAKQTADRFFEAISRLRFLPNSPTLMNAGTHHAQLSACFVLPLENSIDSIFQTLHAAAIIQERGGGTGFDFSAIHQQEEGLMPSNSIASGPLAFLSLFNAATAAIKQAGKRRGANMGVLQVSHPDILDFIRAKAQPKTLEQFNLSVGISDAFMEAVQQDHAWQLFAPDSKKVFETIPARLIWNEMVHHAWLSGDPGLLFINTIQKNQALSQPQRITCTNPCGEVPLLPYESCNLGSINVAAFVQDEKINWTALAEMIHLAVRFLDDVIEVNQYPLPAIEEITKANRKIGLGIMGWADMLLQLRIPYDSDAAVAQAAALMRFVQSESVKASAILAKERGAFPNWDKTKQPNEIPLRNATLNSIAPTGSISMIAHVSASIEPLFALAYHRKHILDGSPLPIMNQHVKKILEEAGLWNEPLIKELKQYGSVAHLTSLPSALRDMLKIAIEIPPMRHLQHQLAFQRYTDNAVSKTINLKHDATEKMVADIFMEAWKGGAKGITVFREQAERNVFVAGISETMHHCKVCR